MALARSEHPAAFSEDEVVVAGGFIEVGVGRTGVTPTVEAYAPDSDTWRALPISLRPAITGWRQWSGPAAVLHRWLHHVWRSIHIRVGVGR